MWLRRVRPIVRHQHERLDGSGCPDGLRGVATLLLVQSIGIVDVDALRMEWPYQVALPVAWAVEELRRALGARRAPRRSKSPHFSTRSSGVDDTDGQEALWKRDSRLRFLS